MNDTTPMWLSTYLPLTVSGALLLLGVVLLLIDHVRSRWP